MRQPRETLHNWEEDWKRSKDRIRIFENSVVVRSDVLKYVCLTVEIAA